MESPDPRFRLERIAAPLRRQVGDALRAAVADGVFKPGDRLIERELCAKFAVSRTSLREAFRALEAEGLIESIPHRGPVVASVTYDQARQIYEVRGVLEALAARTFAERASEVEIAALRVAYRDLASAYRGEDAAARLQAKAHFYTVLLDGTQNPTLAAMLRPLQGRIMLLRAAGLSEEGRLAASIAEIGAIVDAIVARDAPRAWLASTLHIERAGAVALAHLDHADGRKRDERARSFTR